MIELQTLRKRNDSEELRIQSEILRGSNLVLETDLQDVRQKISEQQTGESLGCAFQPDAAKAFMMYEICRTMPHVAGPASSGNYTTLFPAVVEKCHHTLRFQQLNLEHEFKAYDPEGIDRDRIIGAIVNTTFPEWNGELPETAEDAPFMSVTAALWKLAEGVSEFMSDFITNDRKPAVSIEMVADYDNLAIYMPTTREVFGLMDLPEEILFAISENPETGQLILGKTEAGVQLAWAYGKEEGQVSFRGTGVVEFPADKTANIVEISASSSDPEMIQGSSDESVKMKAGDRYVFPTGRGAIVNAVFTSGSHGPDMVLRYPASEIDPVYEFLLDGGQKCWRRKSGITK